MRGDDAVVECCRCRRRFEGMTTLGALIHAARCWKSLPTGYRVVVTR